MKQLHNYAIYTDTLIKNYPNCILPNKEYLTNNLSCNERP